MEAMQIGPYRLERLLGFGGMGEVHLAYDTHRDRMVALKLLPEALGRDPEYQQRFRRESHVAARLRDPHVIPIHDYGEIDGHLYIDMRLVDGRNIRQILTDEDSLSPQRSVHLIAQVAEALEAAHEDGLVHRDIKPSNVLVTASDFVYVVDFGIARSVGTNRTSLTLTGVTVGTLDYMAPERFSTKSIDGRADVYSMACLLYECITGLPPFAGDDLATLMYAHLFSDPPRASSVTDQVGPAMDAVIAKGMAKVLEDRYTTPTELVTAAKAALLADSGQTGDTGTTPVAGARPAGSSLPTAIVRPTDDSGPKPPAPRDRSGPSDPGGVRGSGPGRPIPQAPGPGISTPVGSGPGRTFPPVPPAPPTVAAGRPDDATVRARSHPSGPFTPGSFGSFGESPTVVAPPPAGRADPPPAGSNRGRLYVLLAAGLAVVLVAGVVLVTSGVLNGRTGNAAGGSAAPTVVVNEEASAPPVEIAPLEPSIAVPTVAETVAVGGTPGYMEIAPNGRFAYIAGRASGLVTVFDLTINQVTATIPIPQAPPQFVTFSPDGDRAYVSAYNADFTINMIVTVDTASNTVVGTVPVGRRPFASQTTPDGSRLYVPSHDDGRLDIIDTATNTDIAQIPVAPNPHWVVFNEDGSLLYTANHESGLVSVLDVASSTVVATIPVGVSPHSITISPDGTRVSVVNFDSNEVSIIDTATNTVVATVPVGERPQDIAYAADGRFLYVANVNSDTISVIDTADYRVTATIPAGDGPTSVVVSPDGLYGYVTALNSGEVRVLHLTAA